MAQARSPVFYAGYGVPDTVQGRFDLIVLHLVLVLGRLGEGAGTARCGPSLGRVERAAGQSLFDEFCRDLDDNLREMGVGDLAVPKRMQRFGEAFYGRQRAYRAALTGADARLLEKALARNIFGVVEDDERAVRLARYVRAAIKKLAAQEEGTVMAGRPAFPDPEVFNHAAT